MSAPLNHSINSQIDEHKKRVKYLSFLQLCTLIYKIGNDGYLWTIDAEDAYYRIPINKKFHHLLAIKWRNKYLIFKCLPFGLSTAPSIYNKFADGLKWACDFHKPNLFINTKNKTSYVEHYLDDFVGGSDNFNIANKQMNYLSYLFEFLNLPTSKRKCVGPFKTIDVLGWNFNTSPTMTIAITEKKRLKYLKYFTKIYENNYITINILEKLTGYARHCVLIIPNAKPFCRAFDVQKHYLLKCQKNDKSITNSKKFKISKETSHDINMWISFFKYSKYYILPLKYIIKPSSLVTMNVWTNATTTIGFGGFTNKGNYFKSIWNYNILPTSISKHHKNLINYFELAALVLSAILFAKNWKFHYITFYCDNTTAVSAVNKGNTSLDSTYYYPINNLIKILSILSLKFNFHFRAIHIEGKLNTISDALSRNFDKPLNYEQENLPKINFKHITRSSSKMIKLIYSTFFNKFVIPKL